MDRRRPRAVISAGLAPAASRRPRALIAAVLARAASRAAGVLAECYRAQWRCMVLALAPDRQLDNPDQAPQTYAEFLFRTSGPLLKEPAARDRYTRDRHARDRHARRTGP